MLTKAQERAKTVCRAVGDEDPRRRWGGARGAVAGVLLRPSWSRGSARGVPATRPRGSGGPETRARGGASPALSNLALRGLTRTGVWPWSTLLACAIHLCAQGSGLGPGVWCSPVMARLGGGTSPECGVSATGVA